MDSSVCFEGIFIGILIIILVGRSLDTEPCPQCGRAFSKKEQKREEIKDRSFFGPTHVAYYTCKYCGADRGKKDIHPKSYGGGPGGGFGNGGG